MIAPAFICLVLAAALPASGQPAKPPAGLAAARTLMAGAPLLVQWHGAQPDGQAAFAIALPEAAPGLLVEGTLAPVRGSAVTVTVPGREGRYELRLLRRDAAGTVSVVAHQPLVATAPSATIAAPASVKRGQIFPARGSGPNGERDLVTLVDPATPADGQGPAFLPADSIEGQLEAPSDAGLYELRYVMIAPLSGAVILARQPVRVE